ncbi:MAG: hypothetical protein K2G85_08510 [Muribaculaceae bacterium]|nr:hypothetical protein [Muribaculaceae bacterium]
MAHELYGHGYFYELNKQGYDVNPFHDYKSVTYEGEPIPGCSIPEIISVRVDFNSKLVEQIKIVTNLARKNYNSRNK